MNEREKKILQWLYDSYEKGTGRKPSNDFFNDNPTLLAQKTAYMQSLDILIEANKVKEHEHTASRFISITSHGRDEYKRTLKSYPRHVFDAFFKPDKFASFLHIVLGGMIGGAVAAIFTYVLMKPPSP